MNRRETLLSSLIGLFTCLNVDPIPPTPELPPSDPEEGTETHVRPIYGQSLIEKTRVQAHQLKLMEDANKIYTNEKWYDIGKIWQYSFEKDRNV